MNCAFHPHLEAIGTCSDCGKGVCSYCCCTKDDRIYCPACFPSHAVTATNEDSASARTENSSKPKLGAFLLMLLCALTYLPILIYWDGSSALFVAVLMVAICSFFFQASFILRKSLWAWWGSTISWFADIAIGALATLHSIDPSGILMVFAIFFIGTPALMLLLWDKVSDNFALTVPPVITFIISMLLLSYIILQDAL